MATGGINYSDWQVQGTSQFGMYVPPIIDGYHINKFDTKTVSANDSDSVVNLTYERNEKEKWPMYIDVNGKSYDKLSDGYRVVKGQDSKKGSLLIVKDEVAVVSPKIQYVTRTITVIMPNGRKRYIRQKVRKGTKFLKVHLPRLRGHAMTITGGSVDAMAADSDQNVTVVFTK